MDEQYGKGQWNTPKRWDEFGKLQKYFSRHFQDPKEVPAPYDGPYGMPGGDREAFLQVLRDKFAT